MPLNGRNNIKVNAFELKISVNGPSPWFCFGQSVTKFCTTWIWHSYLNRHQNMVRGGGNHILEGFLPSLLKHICLFKSNSLSLQMIGGGGRGGGAIWIYNLHFNILLWFWFKTVRILKRFTLCFIPTFILAHRQKIIFENVLKQTFKFEHLKTISFLPYNYNRK